MALNGLLFYKTDRLTVHYPVLKLVYFCLFIPHISLFCSFILLQVWSGVTRLTDWWFLWSVASLPCSPSLCCQDWPCFAVIGRCFKLSPRCPCYCCFPIGGESVMCIYTLHDYIIQKCWTICSTSAQNNTGKIFCSFLFTSVYYCGLLMTNKNKYVFMFRLTSDKHCCVFVSTVVLQYSQNRLAGFWPHLRSIKQKYVFSLSRHEMVCVWEMSCSLLRHCCQVRPQRRLTKSF